MFLIYSSYSKGHKVVDLITGKCVTYRGENLKFYEEYTVAAPYVSVLSKNTYAFGTEALLSSIPVTKICYRMDDLVQQRQGSDGLPSAQEKPDVQILWWQAGQLMIQLRTLSDSTNQGSSSQCENKDSRRQTRSICYNHNEGCLGST